MQTILVVDDDVYIGDLLETILTGVGYGVLRAYSGTEALMVLRDKRPDLVLLDLMLPGLSGEEVLPQIRDIPVIALSAKAGVQDKVDVLLGGAADYITKPFDTPELLARIAVRLREKDRKGDRLRWGALSLEPETRQAFVMDQPVHLTRTEYGILKLLLQNPNQVITKSVMLERLAAETPDCVENSLKVHISNLRKKLREKGGKDYIEAVWGIGFKLREKS